MSVDFYTNCRFYVEIQGITQAVFTELSGLQVETVTEDLEEGGNNGFVHRLPGRTKVSNIVLKRGITQKRDLYKWYLRVAQGKVERKNVSVIIYDTTGQELLKWDFANAFPVKWTGPQLDSDGRNVAIETLELAHDGLLDREDDR